MKVLYFHQHFSTPSGSAGTRSYEMARRLIDAGHEVTMVCGSYHGGQTGLDGPFRRGRREGAVDGIQVLEFDLAYANADSFLKRAGLFLLFALRSVAVALTRRYDVVFATSTPLTAGLPGIVARWLRGKTFVFEVRDLWPELPKAMGVIRNPLVLTLMSGLEWASYHSAQRLVALSPGMAEGIRRRGIADERIAMIPNGCDFRIFGNAAAPWRPEGVGEEDLMAIFTGTHGLANGLDAVLDAAAELRRRSRHDIKLVLVGQGMRKPALLERAHREKLDAAQGGPMVFHDPVGKADLAGLMAAADLGMQILANVPAFYYGTSPNKFFDYLSAGLPVLNNYPGWLASMIEASGCGFAVPPDDPAAFADALEAAADDRPALATRGEAALALARRRFDRDALGRDFVGWVVEGRVPARPAEEGGDD